MKRRYRPRKEFKFWLYHDLAEQVKLMEYIKYLNQTRQFATVLRNGLRLMWTLAEGDLSVLFELFPTLQAQFAPKNDELLEQFRQMLLQHQPVAALPVVSTEQRQLTAPIVLDDEQDTVVIKKDTKVGQNITLNFLKHAFALRGDELPASLAEEEAEDKPEPPVQPRPVRVQDDDDDDDYVPALEAGAMVMQKLG